MMALPWSLTARTADRGTARILAERQCHLFRLLAHCALAHRAFCARLIFLRAAADSRCWPDRSDFEPNASSATP
jgi:hypothetical protein